MHEKLSQAVKLYDKLLTDQLSHPTWRRTSPEQARTKTLPSSSTYTQNGYAQSHGPNGYNQWGSSSASSQVPQSPTAQTSFQPTYAPPPPPLPSTSGPEYTQSSYSYNPSTAEQEQRHIIAPPVLPVSSPSWQPLFSGAQGAQTYQPVSVLQAISPVPLINNLGGVDSKGQEPAKSALPSLPESYPQYAAQPTPTPSAPTLPPSVPPLNTVPDRSAITRAHTISSRSSITSPSLPSQPHSPSLVRASTVSHVPPPHARTQSHPRAQPVHALQQPSHPPPLQPQFNPSLPAFPTVPTSTPQAFDLYAPSAPTAPPQERREEMLIEL